MPLNGGGTASRVPGTTAVPNQTIKSADYNAELDDVYNILNTARPIAYGGTGATNAPDAVINLGLENVLQGRLLNVQRFTSSGTYTPTTGTRFIIATLVGGGGAGGGGATTGGGQSSVGSGGSSGQVLKSRFDTGFSGATVTIGSGGTPNSGLAGGAGGSTSLGALATAVGGVGGATAGPTGGVAVSSPTNPSAINSGNILAIPGNPGGSGIIISAGSVQLSGAGAPGPLGGGGGSPSGSSSGGAGAANSGAGGAGGGRAASSGTSVSGGAGGSGIVIIEEYA